MINIAKLLKDAPRGMKLYSPLLGEVEFAEVMDTDYAPIRVMCGIIGERFDKYGRYKGNEYPDAECLLFPSKEVRTWEGWKLPVEHKFEVGDWLYHNTLGVLPIIVKDYSETLGYEVECIRSTYYLQKGVVENEYHPWTIADAKDGDVLVDEDTNTIGIFEKTYGICWHSKIYCARSTYNTMVYHYGGSHDIKFTKPATKEQRDLLFAKMKEAGYEWDAEKKELRKIQHYDISNFYAGMPVLVRDGDSDDDEWTYALFSHYSSNRTAYKFSASGDVFRQCIPYNDDTKHLLGTADMCPEEYINW